RRQQRRGIGSVRLVVDQRVGLRASPQCGEQRARRGAGEAVWVGQRLRRVVRQRQAGQAERTVRQQPAADLILQRLAALQQRFLLPLLPQLRARRYAAAARGGRRGAAGAQ